ncbi:MAG: hypothetical protein AMXMBFR37_04830 [Steroidobacteraceae bacterium]
MHMTVHSGRGIWMRAISLIAIGFGLLTIREGGAVLFQDGVARAAAGDYVPFVLWFNFLAGFAYVIAGVGLWTHRRWAAKLAIVVTVATALVFLAFGVHVYLGGAWEQRTAIAMMLRTLVWAGIATVAWRRLATNAPAAPTQEHVFLSAPPMTLANLPTGKTRWIVIPVALLVLGGALVFWFVRSHDTQDSLRLYGNVDIREVQLAFRQPGRITQMAFDEGDSVSAGTRLAALDAQPYRDALAAAQAQVQVAQAELTKLRRGLRPQEIIQAREALRQAQALATETGRNFQRQSSLLTSGASSQRTVDAARTARDRAIAGVEAAEAALSQANEGFRKEDIAAAEARLAAAQAAAAQAATSLADTELIAPSDGTVIARVREPGSMVANQSTVYSLSLDKPIYVRAYVGEPDLGRIAPGSRVRVKSDSVEKVYRGQIGFISPRAEFTPKTVETADLRTDLVYRLRIVIDATDGDAALRQGMPVTIEVDAEPGTGARAGER